MIPRPCQIARLLPLVAQEVIGSVPEDQNRLRWSGTLGELTTRANRHQIQQRISKSNKWALISDFEPKCQSELDARPCKSQRFLLDTIGRVLRGHSHDWGLASTVKLALLLKTLRKLAKMTTFRQESSGIVNRTSRLVPVTSRVPY